MPLGPLRLIAAGAYVVGLVLAPAVPALLLVFLCALASIVVVAAWAGEGRPRTAGEALWLWPPCHLAIEATGALSSPLLPLFPGWLFLLAATGGWTWSVAGAAAATPAVLAGAAWSGRWSVFGSVEVILLAGGAVAAARYVHTIRRHAADERRALARILTEAEAGPDSPPEAAAAGRLEQLEWSLAGVRRRLGAGRVIIWSLQRDHGLAVAEMVVGGQTPGEVSLATTPFDWVRRERLTVRLDAPPPWAPGAEQVWLARVPGRPDQEQVLSAEFASEFNAPEALEEEAAFLGTVLRIQGREARAVAVRVHLERVLEVLRRLARQMEPLALARELASSAMELTGGTGAAVSRWDETRGTVLQVLGDDGGPAAGAEFGGTESETALAMRNEAAIVREHRRSLVSATPVVTRNERWYSEPRALAAYPLIDGQGVVGALTVWSANHAILDGAGLSVLETILPHAAFQLRFALERHEMRENADTDPLTGLRNRRYLEERFRSECARAVRYQRRLAALILDIDHFKSINDTYGHDVGDAVLQAVGTSIAASVRDSDVTARYGGEEFVVLMPETGLDEGVRIAERLRRVLGAREVSRNGKSISFRVSIGVSAFPECVDEPESLIQSADEALYVAKSGGRDRVVAAGRVSER